VALERGASVHKRPWHAWVTCSKDVSSRAGEFSRTFWGHGFWGINNFRGPVGPAWCRPPTIRGVWCLGCTPPPHICPQPLHTLGTHPQTFWIMAKLSPANWCLAPPPASPQLAQNSACTKPQSQLFRWLSRKPKISQGIGLLSGLLCGVDLGVQRPRIPCSKFRNCFELDFPHPVVYCLSEVLKTFHVPLYCNPSIGSKPYSYIHNCSCECSALQWPVEIVIVGGYRRIERL
jgi:hypothetical protein